MGYREIIGYVAGTVIAGFILFILFGVQARSRQASYDAVQFYAAKQDILNTVQWVQQDFRNIGSYMYWDAGCGCFQAQVVDPVNVIRPGWYDSTSIGGGNYEKEFRFVAQLDSAAVPEEVRYVWWPTGETITLDDGTVRKLHTLSRFVGGDLAGMADGITLFNINLTTGVPGIPIVNLHDTRVIEVEMRGISELGENDVIEETQFNASYHLTSMAITDNISAGVGAGN